MTRALARLIGALLLCSVQGACIQSGAEMPDPRNDATTLSDTHMRADDAFASLDAPGDCPTRLVSYGTNSSSAQVIEYFESRELEHRDGSANDFGNRPRWTGDRLDEGVPQSQVDVWSGPDHGHPEWETVFTIATARCGLTASAHYSVEPQQVTRGAIPTAELVNTGDLALEYGLAYEIERRVAGQWREVPFGKDDGIGCGFPGIGLTLSRGESDTHRVSFCDEKRAFETGVYRVVKTVTFESYKEETLRARFTVAAPRKAD